MKLRGHHLICLQFFKGEGYSKDFVDNVKQVIGFWEKNDVEIVNGADDVCNSCPFLKNGRCDHPKYKEEIDEVDEIALKMLGVKIGDKIGEGFVKKQLPKMFNEWEEKACKDCEWKKLCESAYKKLFTLDV